MYYSVERKSYDNINVGKAYNFVFCKVPFTV